MPVPITVGSTRSQARGASPRPGQFGFIDEVLDREDVWNFAESLPCWKPGDNGRPAKYPSFVMVLFFLLASRTGGLNQVNRDLCDPFDDRKVLWEYIRGALESHFPHHKGMQPGAGPPSRFNYMYFANKIASDRALGDRIEEDLEAIFVAIAEDAGNLNDHEGSLANPAQSRTATGDGVVLAGLYTQFPAGSQFVVPHTGEIRDHRFDPDLNEYTTGDKRQVSGHKLVPITLHGGYENEVFFLSCSYQFPEDGGEMSVARRALARLNRLTANIQAVVWDKAFHGVDEDFVASLGYQGASKVSLVAGEAKSRLVEIREVPGVGRIQIYGIGGAPHVKVMNQGKEGFVRLVKGQPKFPKDKAGKRTKYCYWTIPDSPEVPLEMRGYKFLLRHSTNNEDRASGLNRAEVIRTLPEGDPAFEAIYNLRPGAESGNSFLEQRLPRGNANGTRAPSKGAGRVRFEMLLHCFAFNIEASMVNKRRRTRNAELPVPLAA
jgi:hypothetical protein